MAAVDQVGAAADVGHASTTALVRQATGGSVREAAASVRLADRLSSDLAPVGDLLVLGQLTRRHYEAVVHGVRGLAADVVTQVPPVWCATAAAIDPTSLATVLREHAEAISPEFADNAASGSTNGSGSR